LVKKTAKGGGMAITIITEKMVRWKGTVGDLRTLTSDAIELVAERTGIPPRVAIAATLKKVETQFDSIADFESAVADDFSALEKLVVTIGEFDRNSVLSTEITLNTNAAEPGTVLRVRGHDEAVVKWLAEKMMRSLSRGGRQLSLTLSHIYLIAMVLFIIAQYFFYNYVDLPDMNNWQSYISILIASGLPFAICLSVMRLIGWLVPQLELLPDGVMPRWSRYRRRAQVAVAAAVTSIVLPVVLSLVSDSLK
jgi:hypothetical protein